MASLYETVKRVIEEKDISKATSILYGLDGIKVDGIEYYQRVISEFVRKKDIILQKRGIEITYNLDNDIKDIWDIVFIAQYVYKVWNEEHEKLDKELKHLKSSNQVINKERIEEINQNITLINNYFQKLNKKSELMKVYIETSSIIDRTNIEKELNELKQAILVIQKLRDSFEHRNNKLSIDNLISINNAKNYFKVTIPSEYIDGFVKGRIIAKEEDNDLVLKTNDIVYPILDEFNYDPRKLESFFYNVNPTVLSKLLDYCNNDVCELYKLPISIFSKTESAIEIIFYYTNNGFYSLEQLSQLENDTFSSYSHLCEKNHAYWIDYAKDNNIPLYAIDDIARHSEHDINGILDMLEFIKTNNIDIKEFFAIKKGACIWENYNNITSKRKWDDFKLLYEKCKELGIDYKQIYRICGVYDINNIIDALEFVHKNNINNEIIFNILHNDRHGYEDVIIDIALIDKLNNYLKEHNISNEYLYMLYKKTRFIDNEFEVIPFLENLNKLNKPIDIMVNMNDKVFKYHKNIIDLIKLFQNYNLSINDLQKLPEEIFRNIDDTKMFLDYMQRQGFSIEEILEFPIKNMFIDIRESLKIYSMIKNKYGNEVAKKLPESIYKYPAAFEKLLNYFETNNIDFKKIITQDLYDYDKFGEAMFDFRDITEDDVIEMFETAKKNNVSVDDVFNIPGWNAYGVGYDEMLELFEYCGTNNIDATKVIESIYKGNNCVSDIVKYASKNKVRLDSVKLPDKLMACHFNTENVKLLLEKVDMNYERLNEFPVEFFSCDISVLNELLINYNVNICKSLFGVDNPRLVSTIIYMNSVLSYYNSKTMDSSCIDIEPYTIVHSSFNDTMKYKYNIPEQYNMLGQKEYLNQFIFDAKKGRNRNQGELKDFIITKLRNAGAHFRFKIVKDEAGNIVEDKVYLYDEYNDGTNNFNIIMDIKNIVAIVRQIEIDMNMEKNIEGTSLKKR